MGVEIKIPTIKGLTLKTKETYVEDDITITIDQSLFDQDYTIEDALIERTLTSYTNNRIKVIGERVFSVFPKLQSIEANNVESIGTYAFMNCTGLTKLNFPKVTTFGQTVFSGCSNLAVVKFESLTAITFDLLRGLSALRIAYIPNLESLKGAPFADCIALEALIITQPTKVATLSSTNAFVRSSIDLGTGFIYVPDELVEQYRQSTNWSDHATQIKGLSELPQEIREEIESC